VWSCRRYRQRRSRHADYDDDVPDDDGKDPAAKELGKGGAARAKAMMPQRRAEITSKTAAKGGISNRYQYLEISWLYFQL
jgi:hypothetical protein